MGYASWIIGLVTLGTFATAGFSGWHVAPSPRQVIPASVRNSPGGYRSFHFWHAGWQGGK